METSTRSACVMPISRLSTQRSFWFSVPVAKSRSLRSGRQLHTTASAQSSDGHTSSSDSEDLDYSLSSEFAKYQDPEKFKKMGQHLDLMWSVQKAQRRKPAPCDCCGGSGERECTWCHGTGALTVGETLFCSLQEGCKHCPICKNKGQVQCTHCKGTGFRAAWLPPGCPTNLR